MKAITVCLFVASVGVFVSKGEAQDSQPTVVIFEITTPADALSGVGIFIQDTGKGLVGGVKTTVRGLGEIISSPFKARIRAPKRKFLYEAPEIRISPGGLKELRPPVVTPSLPEKKAPPSKPVEKKPVLDLPAPLYYIPVPYGSDRYANMA